MATRSDAEQRARRARESKRDRAANGSSLEAGLAGAANAQLFNFGDEIFDGIDGLSSRLGGGRTGYGDAIRRLAAADKKAYDLGNLAGSVFNVAGGLGAGRVFKLENAFKNAEKLGDDVNAARIRFGSQGGLREVPERINHTTVYGLDEARESGDPLSVIYREARAGVGHGTDQRKAAKVSRIGVFNRSDDLSTTLGALHGGGLAAGGLDPNDQGLEQRLGESALGAVAGGIAGRYAPVAFDYAPTLFGQARATAPRVLTYRGNPKNRDEAFDTLLDGLARLDEQARRARDGQAFVNSALGSDTRLGKLATVARRQKPLTELDAPVSREFVRSAAAGEGQTRQDLLRSEISGLHARTRGDRRRRPAGDLCGPDRQVAALA